jgi:hypothetical protein
LFFVFVISLLIARATATAASLNDLLALQGAVQHLWQLLYQVILEVCPFLGSMYFLIRAITEAAHLLSNL